MVTIPGQIIANYETGEVTVDGEKFPYAVSQDITTHCAEGRFPSIRLELFARDVQIIGKD